METIFKSKFFQFPIIKKPLLYVYRGIRWMIASILPDVSFLRFRYFCTFHKKLHLESPVTFQEKLQWIKLYDRKPIYHEMADKYDAKRFIKRVAGEEYCIPTLGIYNSFDEIDFDLLPNEFVLKGTFDSGSYVFCHNKHAFDKSAARKTVMSNWKEDYYIWSREWPYLGLKHRIIAEPILKDNRYPYLRDFKFYCFNGEPKVFYITSDKGGDLPTKQDFFDIEGNHIDLQDKHYPNNPIKCPDLPCHLNDMVRLCRVFAKDTYHLRVDFYEIDGHVYCGEFTFFEAGGFCEFIPEEYNRILGDWIHLPIDT